MFDIFTGMLYRLVHWYTGDILRVGMKDDLKKCYRVTFFLVYK